MTIIVEDITTKAKWKGVLFPVTCPNKSSVGRSENHFFKRFCWEKSKEIACFRETYTKVVKWLCSPHKEPTMIQISCFHVTWQNPFLPKVHNKVCVYGFRSNPGNDLDPRLLLLRIRIWKWCQRKELSIIIIIFKKLQTVVSRFLGRKGVTNQFWRVLFLLLYI